MTKPIDTLLSSSIQAVTVFSNGAQITRVVPFELTAGRYNILLKDLPVDAWGESLRVEGQGDGVLNIGIVDHQEEAVISDQEKISTSEREEIEKEIEDFEDENRQVQARIDTLETQKNLINNLAQLPLQNISHSPDSGGQDWHKIYDMIGERLGNANEVIFKAEIEQREILLKIEDLKKKLTQKRPTQEFITAVSIQLSLEDKVKGRLLLRYFVFHASWRPVYDIRLETDKGDKTSVMDQQHIIIERRAEVQQHSGECWDNVALTLSTRAPSSTVSAPELSAYQLDPSPLNPMLTQAALKPRGVMLAKTRMNKNLEVIGEMQTRGEVLETSLMASQEEDAQVDETSYNCIFSVPDRVNVGNGNETVRVFLSSEEMVSDLFIKSVPKLDLQAFLYARFEWAGKNALLAGKSWLYRDGVFIGNGQVKLTQKGEFCTMGFGVDDKVKVSRREMNRITGKRGLIKNQHIDERDFLIEVENLHSHGIMMQIIDQIPFADDEMIDVSLLGDTTEPTETNVNKHRGILLWKQDVSAKEVYQIRLHYKVTWPQGHAVVL